MNADEEAGPHGSATVAENNELPTISSLNDEYAEETGEVMKELHNVQHNSQQNRTDEQKVLVRTSEAVAETSSDDSQSIMMSRRVSFPKRDNELVTGYLEPANPWASVKPVTKTSEITKLYYNSCRKHKVTPMDVVLKHLETLDLSGNSRAPLLNLKEQSLTPDSCEALEEILRRVQYKIIDLSSCDLDDTSASAMFDMIEFYEAATELNISDNINISTRGWQSCVSMIKKSQALQILITRGTPISDSNASNLGKAMTGSSIHTLKLEHCGLTGRPISNLCFALKKNVVLRELWLAHNDLSCYDAYSIGLLLKSNFYLQFLDISNNNIQDNGVSHIAEALIEQAHFFKKVPGSNNSEKSTNTPTNSNQFTNESKKTLEDKADNDSQTISIVKSSAIKENVLENSFKSDENSLLSSKASVPQFGRSMLNALLTNKVDNNEVVVSVVGTTDTEKNNDKEEQTTNVTNCSKAESKLVTIYENTQDNNVLKHDLRTTETKQLSLSENELIECKIKDEIVLKPKTNIEEGNDIQLKIVEDGDTDELNQTSEQDCLKIINVLSNSNCDNLKDCTNIVNITLPVTEISNNNNLDRTENILEQNLDDDQGLNKMNKDLPLESFDVTDINKNQFERSPETPQTKPDSEIVDETMKQHDIKLVDDSVFSSENLCSNSNKMTAAVMEKKQMQTVQHDILKTTNKVSQKEIFTFNTPVPIPNDQMENDKRNNLLRGKVIRDSLFEEMTVPKLSTSSSINDNLLTPDSPGSFSVSQSLDSSSDFPENSPLYENVFEPSQVPERSLSCESLNSNTSLDSNDSKSSIKLAETKFSKNGTLERQVSSPAIEPSLTAPGGLQVLILWNNLITRNSAKPISDMLKATTTLEILNIGKNVLSNDFIANIKTNLIVNTSLTNLGLQSSHLSCAGAKILSEVLQFGGNSTLQRIDLRDNNIQVLGLTAVNDALKSNKTLTRIDLDIVPKRNNDLGTECSDYSRIVANINAQCARNENPPEPEPVRTPAKRARAAYLTSRKISLTCHSIRSPVAIETSMHGKSGQLLDPNRKSGGRLRSPLPSPIPSPISSPVPSPSRNRFQVSRVVEGTSPLTPPSSTSNSPTNSQFSSRFRVTTIVEPPKPPLSTIITPICGINGGGCAVNVGNSSTSGIVRDQLIKPIVNNDTPKVNNSSNKSLESSSTSLDAIGSLDSPDMEVKRYMDDSSSIGSIDSIDRQQDFNISLSSTDSLDMIVVEPRIITKELHIDNETQPYAFSGTSSNSNNSLKIQNSLSSLDASSQDSLCETTQESFHFKNENTLTSTTPNSESSENLNSNEQLLKAPDKRVRKTSWISNPLIIGKGDGSYPATLDKLMSLFQHPLFTRSNTENQKKDQSSETSGPPSRKESPMGGLFSWASGNTKKDIIDDVENKNKSEPIKPTAKSTILQANVSPETSVSAAENLILADRIPSNLKQEMKENISPEHTITASSVINIQSQSGATKVKFEVGGDDNEDDVSIDGVLSSSTTIVADDDNNEQIRKIILSNEMHGLGQIARDSMSILISKSNNSQDSIGSVDSLPEIEPQTVNESIEQSK